MCDSPATTPKSVARITVEAAREKCMVDPSEERDVDGYVRVGGGVELFDDSPVAEGSLFNFRSISRIWK